VVVPSYRSLVVAVAAVMSVYVLLRVSVLRMFEARQPAFESTWLTQQSQWLQRHSFEVVRFSTDPRSGSRRARRTFDLTDPYDVRELLSRQAEQRHGAAPVRVHIEFIYWPGEGAGQAVEGVRRDLKDIEFFPIEGPISTARLRLPKAVYVSRPDSATSDARRPGRFACWFLAGPVRLTVAHQGPAPAAGRSGPVRATSIH
jgi:hypothetical protein